MACMMTASRLASATRALRSRDIERALAGATDDDKRDLQQEAVAHYRVHLSAEPERSIRR